MKKEVKSINIDLLECVETMIALKTQIIYYVDRAKEWKKTEKYKEISQSFLKDARKLYNVYLEFNKIYKSFYL